MKIVKIIVKSIIISIIIVSLLLNVILSLPIIRKAILEHMIYISKEISRTTSPDGQVDVVVIMVHGGPINEDLTDVIVVPKGQSASWKFGDYYPRVFEGYFMEGLTVAWKKDGFLEIRYDEGVVSLFKNYLYPFPLAASEKPQYLVQIREIPLSEAPLPLRFFFKWNRKLIFE